MSWSDISWEWDSNHGSSEYSKSSFDGWEHRSRHRKCIKNNSLAAIKCAIEILEIGVKIIERAKSLNTMTNFCKKVLRSEYSSWKNSIGHKLRTVDDALRIYRRQFDRLTQYITILTRTEKLKQHAVKNLRRVVRKLYADLKRKLQYANNLYEKESSRRIKIILDANEKLANSHHYDLLDVDSIRINACEVNNTTLYLLLQIQYNSFCIDTLPKYPFVGINRVCDYHSCGSRRDTTCHKKQKIVSVNINDIDKFRPYINISKWLYDAREFIKRNNIYVTFRNPIKWSDSTHILMDIRKRYEVLTILRICTKNINSAISNLSRLPIELLYIIFESLFD